MEEEADLSVADAVDDGCHSSQCSFFQCLSFWRLVPK